ncbi:MAG: sigma-E factor negative regulatory protein [Rugosibacter sp.]
MKIQISALMDGELDAHEAADALRALSRDAMQQKDWHLYHLIGDALRQEPFLAMDIAARVAPLLALEPTVLAPVRTARNRPRWQRPLMAAAATVAGVALVAWVALAPVAESGHPAIASAKPPVAAANVALAANTSPAADDQSAYLQEYLVAHQAYAPSGSLIGGSNHIRTVTAASVVTSGERR